MGDKDLIPYVLQELGAEILFHKVAIKPGKPILMARLANEAIVFALPGNPISTAVGWQMFVLPYLRYSCAMAPELPTMVRLAHDYRKTGDLTLFLKAHLGLGQNLELVADINTEQQSFKTKSFAQSDGFVRLDPGRLELRTNDPLACYLFNP
jgi:molybdopterin molybdotransferase